MIYQAHDENNNLVWVLKTADSKTVYVTESAARTALQELVMNERQTAAQEWETKLRALIESARTVITQSNELSLLAQTNGISETIAATADGAFLEGTTITKEDAQYRAALFAELQTWLLEGTPSRLGIIFRRF
jgi:hypothetical protein